MKEKLKQHLNEVFRGAPHTEKNEALYVELLGNLYDRYDERVAAGDTEEEACRRVIADLGDITPLIERTPASEPTTQNAAPGEPAKGQPKKRHVALIVTLCVVAALLSAAVFAVVLIARHYEVRMWWDQYDARYTETGGGTVQDTVTALDIDWRDGSVTVEPYDGDAVTFSERRDGEPVSDPDEAMRWYFADGALHIRYKKWTLLYIESKTQTGKDLVVYLPRAMAENLTKIQIDNLSSALTLRDLNATSLVEIDTLSGGVTLTNVTADHIDIDTASGDVNATGIVCRELNVDVASGRITASGAIRKINADTVSGALILTPGADAQTIDCDSVSGNITVILPADIGVTVDMESVSGRIDSTVALTSSGGRHTAGNGAVEIDVDTVSGNLILRTAE